jgi:hypothetical protein
MPMRGDLAAAKFASWEEYVMEIVELSASLNRVMQGPLPGIFFEYILPRTETKPQMDILDDRRFDQRALLRWADDGGCWVGKNNSTLHEVHI